MSDKLSKSKYCSHTRPNGKRCPQKRRPGSKYCPVHARVHDKRVTHGQKTDFAKSLGIVGDEAISYEDFLRDQKPHKLHREMAQARSLLVQFRKAYQKALQDSFKADYTQDAKDYIVSYLVEKKKTSPDKAERIAELVSGPIGDAFDEHLSALAITPDYIKTVSSLIKLIVSVGEKMKKIEEGQTFIVNIKTEYLVEFLREDVFPTCKSMEQRQQIVESLQARLCRNGIPKALLPEGNPEVIEAEFEEVEDEDGL